MRNYSRLFLNLSFVLVIIFIYFFCIGNYGLLDKDEPRYCSCALEMLENNDWTIPKFNFQNRFDKPPLFYWLIATSYKLFGISDFTSRMPSAICAILTILFTWYVANKIFGRLVGFISAIILGTSIEFILLGHRAATDMALCFFFSGSLYSILLSYALKNFKLKIFWVCLSGIFAGFSILTKGPIGIILPLIILTFFLLSRKQFDIKHLKTYFLVCFFALVICLPWFFAVHKATNGEFTNEFFLTHNIKRFTSIVGEHPGPVWFYIPVILGGFMPWSVFFLVSLFYLTKYIVTKKMNKFILFNFIWVLVVFLFFTFSKTKLATYILLIFPPLAQITAYWVSIIGRRGLNNLKKIIYSTLILVLPALGFGLYLISKWKIDVTEKKSLLIAMLAYIVLLSSMLLMSFAFSRKTHILIYLFSISISIPFVLGFNSYLVNYYNYTHADLREFARMAKEKQGKEIISFGMYRPSLVYYSRIPVNFEDKKSQIRKIKGLTNQVSTFVVGHTSDIDNHKELFQKIKVIEKRKKYFIGIVN